MNDHGVALVALEEIPGLFAQCECGWHENFGEVTTFDAVSDAVNNHHQEASQL